jgi:hypothetical protein
MKARARKQRYLNNQRKKKLKLDIDNLPEKFSARLLKMLDWLIEL